MDNIGAELSMEYEWMNELPMIPHRYSKPRSLISAFHGHGDKVGFALNDFNGRPAQYANREAKGDSAYIVERHGLNNTNYDQLTFSYLTCAEKVAGKTEFGLKFHGLSNSYQTSTLNVVKLQKFDEGSEDLPDQLEKMVAAGEDLNGLALDKENKLHKTKNFFVHMMAMVSLLTRKGLLLRHNGDLSNFKLRPATHQEGAPDGGVYTFYRYENLHVFDRQKYTVFAVKRFREKEGHTEDEEVFKFKLQDGGRSSQIKYNDDAEINPDKWMLKWNIAEAIHLTEKFARKIGCELPNGVQEFRYRFNLLKFEDFSHALNYAVPLTGRDLYEHFGFQKRYQIKDPVKAKDQFRII